jgi:hypothetical protein
LDSLDRVSIIRRSLPSKSTEDNTKMAI